MTEIAILTPDAGDPSYASQWPGVLDRLTACLARVGVTTQAHPWTDHVDDASGLARYPLVLPLVAWGYHRDHGRWVSACRAWTNAGLAVLNPASVLEWNADKAYLGRLADAGVAIPPTVWVEGPTQDDLDTAFERLGAATLVIKPRVSGGAWKTQRLNRGDRLESAPEGPAMIQPYLPSIESEGETSLLFFGGRLSHAVNKRPIAGDFRIQVQFGGRYAPVEPEPDMLTLAERTLAAIDEDLLYARVDMARGPDGGWLLMEAELIEPDFYLEQAPDRGTMFARAVRARLDGAARAG